MSKDHGPLGDLVDTLSGAAAGHYGMLPKEDLDDVSETQSPLGDEANPLRKLRPDELAAEDARAAKEAEDEPRGTDA